MLNLKQRITEEMKGALRDRDAFRLSVLRLVWAGITNLEIDKHEPLTDQEIVAVIQRQVKQRREAIELYRQGNRSELADKEEKEIEILNNYLPQQMIPKEVENIVDAVISELPDDQKIDFGKVMKAVMEQTKGQADGKLVATLVREKIK